MKQLYVRYCLLFLCTAMMCVTSWGQKKLVIIGSSTSACIGPSHPDSCYVSRVSRYYKSQGILDTIINLAVGGGSVYRGMPSPYNPLLCGSGMLPDQDHNITAALEKKPDVILVSYPSNEYDVLSVSQVMCCLRTIKSTANRAGKPCYISTTQPRSSGPSFNTSATKKKMAELKDSILNEFGQFAIDFYSGIVNPADSTILPAYSTGDGIHLNNAGHAVLAQRVQQKNLFAQVSLPVTFLSVTGFRAKSETNIKWATVNEKNIRHFEVQRSEDGVHYLTIQNVSANNMPEETQYSFTDSRPLLTAFYRIAAINLDNRQELSKVIRISHQGKVLSIEKLIASHHSLFAEIQCSEKQTLEIQVLNNMGQVLTRSSVPVKPGINAIPVQFQPTGKGVYYFRVRGNGSGWQAKAFIND